VTELRASLLPATPATRWAVRAMVATILLCAGYLVLVYPTLPWLLPVRFRGNGMPIGWQYRTLPRVLMPVFVQVALAVTFGAISMLLLSRSHGRQEAEPSEVQAAGVAAETVAFIAFIWVAFQAYAAVALVTMWRVERGGLGPWYTYLQLAALTMTGIVVARAHARIGRPSPRPFVAAHWRFGQLYRNPDDPALFVPTRDGSRWTLNFGRPIAAALLGLIIAIGIIGPTIILGLALR
jgi:uncharacterized membrane protein